MRKVILTTLLLAGCCTTPPPVVVTTPVYHPEMPTPYSVCSAHWEVLEVDERAKIALSYNDNVTVAICAKDLQRILSEQKTIICHYRAELKESQCSKELHDNTNP